MSGASLVAFRQRGGKAAVVFVHGFRGDAAKTWGEFPQFLTQEPRLDAWDVFGFGYPTSLRVDVPGVFTANPDLNKLALEMLSRLSLPPFNAYGSIAIVAHSMGGLVAQRALLMEQLRDRVGHLILFGTPSNGLHKAIPLVPFLRQARDMATDSAFLTALRSEWSTRFGEKRPFLLRVVAGNLDEFVPASSSLEPFPEDVRRVVPGNHLQIVDLDSASHPSAILVIDALTGMAKAPGTVDSALVAVELRQFQRAIDLLLPNKATIDDAALVQLALALDGVGRGDDALRILDERSSTATDAMGVLGGRLKRRWLIARQQSDWNRAHELYEGALAKAQALENADQSMYHAINLAFLELMITPESDAVPKAAKDMALLALEQAAAATAGHWRAATEGEARLVLGDLDEASRKYREALAFRPGSRATDSMYLQAIRVAARVFGETGERAIETAFGVNQSPE
jgi:pimeloyl-ACP methyl ester carboxylesterase